jgi:hypothetical protein
MRVWVAVSNTATFESWVPTKARNPSGESAIASQDMPTRNPIEYFLGLDGARPTGILDPEIAADGVRITDAAIRSSNSGCAEKP